MHVSVIGARLVHGLVSALLAAIDNVVQSEAEQSPVSALCL